MDDQYYTVNREYVNKAIEHFTNMFRLYIVEMLERTYPNGLPPNIEEDINMNGDSKFNSKSKKLTIKTLVDFY